MAATMNGRSGSGQTRIIDGMVKGDDINATDWAMYQTGDERRLHAEPRTRAVTVGQSRNQKFRSVAGSAQRLMRRSALNEWKSSLPLPQHATSIN
jgi:hypothetical protein